MPRYEVYYEMTILDAQETDADTPEQAADAVHRRLTMLYPEIQHLRVTQVWNNDTNEEVTMWTKGSK